MGFKSNAAFPFVFQAEFPSLQTSVASQLEESAAAYHIPTGMTFWPVGVQVVLSDDVSATGSISFGLRKKSVAAYTGAPVAVVSAAGLTALDAKDYGSSKCLSGEQVVISATPSSDWTVNNAAVGKIWVFGFLTSDQ